MTIEEAYNLVIFRVTYVESRLWEYTKLETPDERAYFIGQMHQHLMEAKQVIKDFEKQKFK